MRWGLLVPLLLLGSTACKKQADSAIPGGGLDLAKPAVVATMGVSHQALPAAPATLGESLYQLEAELSDQDGHKIPLAFYAGHPVIISMFYAHCPNACPLLISKIQRIEDRLPPEVRAELRVLLVSFDPQSDTAAVLKGLATKQGVDERRWRFVRTQDTSIRDIAAVLGIKYRKLDDGNFNHSSVLTLLDRAGRLSSRLEGLADPVEDFVAKILAVHKAR